MTQDEQLKYRRNFSFKETAAALANCSTCGLPTIAKLTFTLSAAKEMYNH